MRTWSVGDLLSHRFNPDLGTGRVTAVDGRIVVVHFQHAGVTLRLAAGNDALVPEADATRPRDRSLLLRLAAGDVDEPEDWLTRLDVLHVLSTREANGLGSFLGGRVGSSRISCTSPNARPPTDPSAGSSPTRWASARRSRPPDHVPRC